MMKTLFITNFFLVIILFSENVRADNFYIGLGVGSTHGQGEKKSQFSAAGGTLSQTQGARGVLGKIYASWETPVFDNGLFGLEVSGEVSNACSENENKIFTETHVTNLDYKSASDLALQFGYRVKKGMLIYLKAGLSFAQWRLGSKNSAGRTLTVNKNLWGFRPALGLSFSIGDNWLSLEYSYGMYQKISVNDPAATFFGGGGSARISVRPRLGNALLKFSYKL